MIYMVERWKITVVLLLSLLLTGLACFGSLQAQIKKEEVDFEVMATVTFQKGDNLWDLAQKYYGDPLKWPLIKDMNKIPNEGAIPVGTVVYVPVKDAKRMADKVKAEIEEKSDIEKKLSAEIQSLKAELRDARARDEECASKNKLLQEKLEEKDASMKELEGILNNVKATMDKMKAEAELEAQAQEMRAQAQAATAKKDNAKLSSSLEAKEKLIEELEGKLRECRRSIEVLEKMRNELNAKIRKAEMTAKPPAPAEPTADSKARIAAIAIALVGALIWIGAGN
jgi:hypothetical protein